MIVRLRGTIRFCGAIIAATFAGGFASACSAQLGTLLLILGLPIILVVFLVGGVFCIVRVISSLRSPAEPRSSVASAVAVLVMLTSTIVLAHPSFVAGGVAGSIARITVNRDHYEAIIARAKQGQVAAGFPIKEDGGITYIVDTGPPVRVAFNPVIVFDEWSGLVFDPTGEVMQEGKNYDPATGRFYAPDRITNLFGGNLAGCHHVWGDYYDCSFI